MQEEDQHPINAKGWMDVYPVPKPRSDFPLSEISVEELSQKMDREEVAGKDFCIVDVRRADCVSMVPGAINLPAHSLFVSLPTLVRILSTIPLVVFHCNRSTGRGPRAAGWYADALQAHLSLSDEDVAKRVGILRGGIVAWESQFGQGSLEQRGARAEKKTIQL